MKKESRFQAELIRDIQRALPGSYVLKNDGSNVPQGFPDLLILHKNHWGALECKREHNSARQPNQEYYVQSLDDMSFSRFISPENKDEVLNELFEAFGLGGPARVSGGEQISLDQL